MSVLLETDHASGGEQKVLKTLARIASITDAIAFLTVNLTDAALYGCHHCGEGDSAVAPCRWCGLRDKPRRRAKVDRSIGGQSR